MGFDANIIIWLNHLTDWPLVRSVALWMSVYGLLLYVVVAIWCWYHPSNKQDRWQLQQTVVLAILGVMVTIVFEQIISGLFFRARPFAVIDTLTAYNVFVDSTSFPSLHTAMAAAFAGAWLWTGRQKTGGWLLLWALLIGLSRVMAGVHYPTDVIGGVASGLIASWLVWHQSHWLSDKLDD